MTQRRAATLLSLLVMLTSRPAFAQKSIARADDLGPYVGCNLGPNLSVEDSVELDQPFVRSVNTAKGSRGIGVLHGISLHIAYAATPFVNFKAERLAHFDSAKRDLVESLRFAAAGTSDIEQKTPQRSSINGFDVRSIDRTTLSGGVESVYMLFRDADQTVVTLYILNTPPEDPQFSTMGQYRALRDAFIRTYTACVAKKLGARPSGRVG